jgi:hypothetical protein
MDGHSCANEFQTLRDVSDIAAHRPAGVTAELRLMPIIACLVLFLATSTSCLAQIDISASLAGTVTDQNGAVVPGAALVARSVQTGQVARTVSNETGFYQFPSLAAGNYTVSCTIRGFKTFTANDVILHAGGTVTLPVSLQVGATVETVTVSGSSAMVDTETANNLTTIDSDLIEGIPVQGRDPRESMEVLMPGATAAGTGASFFIPVTSFNGVSQLTNNYDIDGAAMNDYMHGSAAADFPQSENTSEWHQRISRPVLDLPAERRLGCELLVQQLPGRPPTAISPGVVRRQRRWAGVAAQAVQRQEQNILLPLV